MSTLLKIAKIAKANLLTKLIITEPIRNTGHFERKNFEKKYIIDENKTEDGKVLTLTKDNNYKAHIIYLHGGSFTDEALIVHRIFIERILDKYETKVSFVDYPLTPECDYVKIQKFTLDAINNLMNKYNDDEFYFIGDSAGGGLAVSMLQQLSKCGINIKKSILLSPWIDVSMTNPKIKDQIKKDFTLNLDSIITCGKNYAGELSTTSGIVSPIYGDLKNLGSLLIYVSNNELLYPDIIKFYELVNQNSGSVANIIIGNNLCHDYPLLIIKETKGIIREMMTFLLNNK